MTKRKTKKKSRARKPKRSGFSFKALLFALFVGWAVGKVDAKPLDLPSEPEQERIVLKPGMLVNPNTREIVRVEAVSSTPVIVPQPE